MRRFLYHFVCYNKYIVKDLMMMMMIILMMMLNIQQNCLYKMLHTLIIIIIILFIIHATLFRDSLLLYTKICIHAKLHDIIITLKPIKRNFFFWKHFLVEG